MSATDRLREAAERIRTVAKRAAAVGSFTPETWRYSTGGIGYDVLAGRNGVTVSENSAEEEAEHIALWSPPVALAVAILLDKEAEGVESGNWRPCTDDAVALADAILGGQS